MWCVCFAIVLSALKPTVTKSPLFQSVSNSITYSVFFRCYLFTVRKSVQIWFSTLRYATGSHSCSATDSLIGSLQRQGRHVFFLHTQKDGKKDRAAVDKVFFLRMLRIMRIMVPRFFCMEVRHGQPASQLSGWLATDSRGWMVAPLSRGRNGSVAVTHCRATATNMLRTRLCAFVAL